MNEIIKATEEQKRPYFTVYSIAKKFNLEEGVVREIFENNPEHIRKTKMYVSKSYDPIYVLATKPKKVRERILSITELASW